jgi:hypothetical protein
MKRFIAIIVASAALVMGGVALAPAAGATPVPVGAVWQEFGFGTTGSFATSGVGFVPGPAGTTTFAPDPPWTFTLAGPGTLSVTDAFQRGDVFEVFDSGVSLGTSSAVPTDDGCGSNDPDVCVGVNSSANFLLGSGSHSLTIQAIASPYNGGAAFFRVQNIVFAGDPSKANCIGKTVSAFSNQYGDLEAAVAAFGYPSVQALQDAIKAFCGQ